MSDVGYRVARGWLGWLEHALERALRLEHGANIIPLMHVVLYYAIFVMLAVPGWVTSPAWQALLWIGLVLLNYSLSIGIQHLHSHRKLFTAKLANRVLEALLCFPCVTSHPMMKYVHVYLHHRHDNGWKDPTSTVGYERGARAVWYWVSYSFSAQWATFRGLFARDATPGWRRLRTQYVVDTLGTVAAGLTLLTIAPWRMFLIYELPLLLILVNIGFFAWLTHAPAFTGPLDGSLNTANNVMNVLIHNQGYHAVHHRYPGIHWTTIPDRLELMRGVDERLIVPYWVTLPSAWRILRPERYHHAAYGRSWKARYERKSPAGRHRVAWIPYFGWI